MSVAGIEERFETTVHGELLMPQRKRRDGTHVDIVSPIDAETRQMIEEKVFAAYKVFINQSVERPV